MDYINFNISKEIWENKQLTILDKLIYAKIRNTYDYLTFGFEPTNKDDYFSWSNKKIAQFFDCSERKVTDSINKLLSLNYIELINFDGRERKIKPLK